MKSDEELAQDAQTTEDLERKQYSGSKNLHAYFYQAYREYSLEEKKNIQEQILNKFLSD